MHLFAGTSDVYRGDSSINVFGDLLSCAVGYNFARGVFGLLILLCIPKIKVSPKKKLDLVSSLLIL